MRKLLLLLTLFTAVWVNNANAQGGDPAAREARMKEMKTQLIEKVKLSEVEADKVIEITNASREQMRDLRDLSEPDRTKKTKAIPLTDDQVKALNEYMAERRKNMPRPGGQ